MRRMEPRRAPKPHGAPPPSLEEGGEGPIRKKNFAKRLERKEEARQRSRQERRNKNARQHGGGGGGGRGRGKRGRGRFGR